MLAYRGLGVSGPSPASHLFPLSFLFVIEHMMPLCMVISWVYSVAMTIQHIVAEKEHRLKEVSLASCRTPFQQAVGRAVQACPLRVPAER